MKDQKLIRLSDELWINPDHIVYIRRNAFTKGNFIKIQGDGLNITDEETKILFKYLGIKQ